MCDQCSINQNIQWFTSESIKFYDRTLIQLQKVSDCDLGVLPISTASVTGISRIWSRFPPSPPAPAPGSAVNCSNPATLASTGQLRLQLAQIKHHPNRHHHPADSPSACSASASPQSASAAASPSPASSFTFGLFSHEHHPNPHLQKHLPIPLDLLLLRLSFVTPVQLIVCSS